MFQVIHNLSKLSVRDAATVSPGGAFPVIGEMYKDAKGNIINGNMPSYTGAFVNSTCSSHMCAGDMVTKDAAEFKSYSIP